MRAMDLPRTVILGTVERDQHVPAEAAEHVEAFIDPSKLINSFGEYGVQQRRRGRVEQVADVIVGGDFGDAEQAGTVGEAMPFLVSPLMRQERRALHEKHRKAAIPMSPMA
jgi:hypothetical protein